mgnify:CR=1 FL=1
MSVSEKGDEAITSSDGDVILVGESTTRETHVVDTGHIYSSFPCV